MGSLNDKVRKARRDATKPSVGNTADKTIKRNAETAGVKLSLSEKRSAREVLVPRIKIDRERTAARGMAIEKTQAKKAAAKRAAAAIGNAPASKKTAAKSSTVSKVAKVAKKAMVDPTSALSKSSKSKATSAPKVATKPKPASSPTAASQLKNVRATMMNIPKDEQGNSLKYTSKDPNVYTGTYNGKEYTWKNGKFVK